MSRTSVPTLYLCGGRQTIGGDRTSLPSARRGKRDHERSWVKRVFISSLHTSRSKVHEEGHPSCQARTGKNSCVNTALFFCTRTLSANKEGLGRCPNQSYHGNQLIP